MNNNQDHSSSSSSSSSSYPPVFRQQQSTKTTSGLDQDDAAEIDTTTRSKEIIHQELEHDDPVPVIDLQCLNSDKKLAEACKDWGLFRLVNHGVPTTLLTQLQDHARELFSLSFESKQALLTSPLSYFWGTPALTPSGTALSSHQNSNWMEGVNVPLRQLAHIQAGDPLLDSFRALLEEYGRHLGELAVSIYKAMARNLNLQDPVQSKSYLSESTGFLRVYRYPQTSMANEGLGMEVHTDSSVLSILSQEDQVGGLEVLKDDKWLHVKPIPGTLLVNLGDMIQAISDDEYKSVTHRVRVNRFMERHSICYFVFPAEGSVILSTKYRSFSYSDFQAQVQQDIKTVGFKVGLERFKLKDGS